MAVQWDVEVFCVMIKVTFWGSRFWFTWSVLLILYLVDLVGTS